MMQTRIAEGTEKLSEAARDRVVAARRKAIAAQRDAARKVRKGADALSDFYDEQPLVVGALAFAAGAILAGALPKTRTENSYLGPHSERLFQEAERVFADETAKLSKVVSAAKEEAVEIASEMKKDLDRGVPGDGSAAEALASTAKEAGRRVAEAARETAREENLGNPTA